MKPQLEILGRFTFNLDGFNATYRYNGRTTTLTLCPGALCQLLEDTKLIEGFDLDANGEPVILFSETDPVRAAYGFDRWASFVKTFPISYRMAVKLLEWREERREHREFQARIVTLLSPLQAA